MTTSLRLQQINARSGSIPRRCASRSRHALAGGAPTSMRLSRTGRRVVGAHPAAQHARRRARGRAPVCWWRVVLLYSEHIRSREDPNRESGDWWRAHTANRPFVHGAAHAHARSLATSQPCAHHGIDLWRASAFTASPQSQGLCGREFETGATASDAQRRWRISTPRSWRASIREP